jgi:hypothetical protein
MKLDKRKGAIRAMTHKAKDIAAFHLSGAGTTHAKGEIRGDDIRVTERHGIWTVTSSGAFLGDYHDPQIALAAAAQARHRGHGSGRVGDLADPWHRHERKATP